MPLSPAESALEDTTVRKDLLALTRGLVVDPTAFISAPVRPLDPALTLSAVSAPLALEEHVRSHKLSWSLFVAHDFVHRQCDG
eukprot:CAMPEP_0194481542 /NCGR_PEP_ID=MMETSP0253-20130528/3914_1 /TAXON_ID=2966 /ORGANISM="Noctiluca scintillans" /LENGTH=82 /DNA_ID=CAMNT_0039321031 /DNA_START=475 /DNA_END=723 /DNA_ORIENTATION=-